MIDDRQWWIQSSIIRTLLLMVSLKDVSFFGRRFSPRILPLHYFFIFLVLILVDGAGQCFRSLIHRVGYY